MIDRAAIRSAFDEDVLLREARALARLAEFGDESFRAPLRVLLGSLREEAPLNAVGIAMLRARILESLTTRLRTEDWLRREPAILDERIVAPLVVIGQTRTGTTMLQRLLASDPRHHAALWWEVRFPAPLPGTRWSEPDPRISLAEAEVAGILAADPEQASIHPWDAQAPDEEIMLLEHSFLSHVPEAFTNLPSYRAWIDSQDWSPAYADLKKFLQFLQWQKRQRGSVRERWVLKTPGHLGYVETLLATFPGARIVQTHRDPLQTLPSAASLNRSLWRLSSDEVDAREIGRQWKQRVLFGLERCQRARERLPRETFADVWFGDALADPLGEVERIYATFGIALTEAARSAMRAWLAANRRDKRPAHEYTLAEFGFDAEELRREFADYRRRFVEPRLRA